MALFSSKPRPTVQAPMRIAPAGTSMRQSEVRSSVKRWKLPLDLKTPGSTCPALFTLKLEWFNEHDPRAVAVYYGRVALGYLPRGRGEWVHSAVGKKRGSVNVEGQFIVYEDGALGIIFPEGE